MASKEAVKQISFRILVDKDKNRALYDEHVKYLVLDLLKCSLLSENPLTDTFLRKNRNFENQVSLMLKIDEGEVKEGRKKEMKVIVAKGISKILCAQVGEDLMDQILSLLILPLGAVVRILQGDSSLRCINNLYKSVAELDATTYFISQEAKKKLIDPLTLDLESPTLGASIYAEGYVKRPSKFIMADNLSVRPFSVLSALSFLKESNFYNYELEERVISIGVKELLGILKASITSSSALTNGLRSTLL